MREDVSSAMSLRAPRSEDAASIAALAASNELALFGHARTTDKDIRFPWQWPGFDLERDAWVVESVGACLGYGWIWGPRAPNPEYDGRLLLERSAAAEVGARLLDRMERRVAEKSAKGPSGASPRLAIFSSDLDQPKQALLAARGYLHVRTYFRMERSLEGSWPSPPWPADMDVAAFRAGLDERDLYTILEEAFAHHYRVRSKPFEEWTHRVLGHDGFAPELSFLVRHRGETVAASVNFRAEPDTGSIGMLGVRAPWRRRGLGRALLLHSFDAFRAAGLRSARLGVDAGNTDRAVALYESVGMAITRRDLLFERTLGS